MSGCVFTQNICTQTTPHIHKVELSQKQAMRRDDDNIRVSSGVKYQLRLKGVNLEQVNVCEARLGRLSSSTVLDAETQVKDDNIHWLSFETTRPIETLDVVHSGNGSSSNVSSPSSQKESPVSTYSDQSLHSGSGKRALIVAFSLKKFSEIKKIDKTLPPAKKITFVLSIRFATWPGEARVFFKFSTRSKAESSKEWKLEKVLDSNQHPNLIQLVEPQGGTSPMSTTSSVSGGFSQQQQQGLLHNLTLDTNSGTPSAFSMMHNLTPPIANMDDLSNQLHSTGHTPNSAGSSQFHQQNFMSSTNSSTMMSSQNGSYYLAQQQARQFYFSNPSLFGQLSPQQQQQINALPFGMGFSNMNGTGAQNATHPFLMQQQQFQQQQQAQKRITQGTHNPVKNTEKSTTESRKRSRESFSPSAMDTMMQRSAKKKSLENQLDSLSREEGPANKVHPVTGVGRFYSLKAPVFIYFGSAAGRVECITPNEISLLVPAHEPTPKPVNVTLQNADRVPITSFAQYRFLEEKPEDDSDINSITHSTSVQQRQQSVTEFEENLFFRDFDFDLPMESIFGSAQIDNNLDGIDSLGQSLLHRAASDGHSRLVLRLLLAEGNNPLHQDNIGRTAFHVACARGNLDCSKILLYFGGADLYFIEDAYSMVGVDLALSCNQKRLVERLQQWLANPSAQQKFFEDVERFSIDWEKSKEQTVWPYDRNGESLDVHSGRQSSQIAPPQSLSTERLQDLERQNQQLRNDLERSEKKSKFLELRMKQRFITRLKNESEERRNSRSREALLPEFDLSEELAPLPELEMELLANAQPEPEEPEEDTR